MKIRRILFLITICFFSIASFSSIAASKPFNPTQTKAIQQITKKYLLENPEILMQMSKNLQTNQINKAILGVETLLFGSKESPILGDKKGTINLVEFFDYQCSHCKRMEPIIEDLSKIYPKVRFVMKEFPIFGESSMYASSAALASVKQGKYKIFHEALMKTKGRLSKDKVIKVAKSVGLNIETLKQDMKSPAIEKELKDNYLIAQKLGINGTPAFIVGAYPQNKAVTYQLVPGGTTQAKLAALLKKALKQAKQ